MDYWALIAELPAAISASALVVNLLPFSVDKKFNPLIMFVAALLSLFLPWKVVIALAMCIPMGFLYQWLGIRLQGHEPFKLPVREMGATLRRLREHPHQVMDILTRGFPNPAEQDEADDVPDEAEAPDDVPEMVPVPITSHIPDL
jgi:hypothetical protein